MNKTAQYRVAVACMVVGALVIFAAAALYLYIYLDDRRAGQTAAAAVARLEQHIEDLPSDGGDAPEPVFVIDGVAYLGYISFTGYDRTLPVIADWNFDDLEMAPVRYAGSVAGRDIVIAGHNYRSHFTLLHSLVPGNEVVFTDALGNDTHYLVKETETLRPTDVEKMELGDWDLTLFTCTPGGRARAAVRCAAID